MSSQVSETLLGLSFLELTSWHRLRPEPVPELRGESPVSFLTTTKATRLGFPLLSRTLAWVNPERFNSSSHSKSDKLEYSLKWEWQRSLTSFSSYYLLHFRIWTDSVALCSLSVVPWKSGRPQMIAFHLNPHSKSESKGYSPLAVLLIQQGRITLFF